MVDDDFDPVIARLQCGELLYDLRENYAKVKFADAAKMIGTYAGKLSKIENGDVAPRIDDVEKLISLYGLPSDWTVPGSVDTR